MANPRPTVALIGTLDTKGAEYQWMAERLTELGIAVLVIDAGIRPPQGFSGEIEFDQTSTAEAAGTTIDVLSNGNDRGVAVTSMGEGAAVVFRAPPRPSSTQRCARSWRERGVVHRCSRNARPARGPAEAHRLDHGIR